MSMRFQFCLDTQDTEEIIETVIRIAPHSAVSISKISRTALF